MLGRMMASALALTGVAYAQTPPEQAPAAPVPTAGNSDRVVYEAGFFAQYNPQTALDMVRQTPGFTLDEGDDERRGFSGAVGNLLVDGERPSSKSQTPEDILSRIPANQVVRVEVLRGGAVAGDASGQSVLVNVVRTPTGGSGVYEVGFEYTSREIPAPRGELSYAGRVGQVEYGVGFNYFSQVRDLPGWRRLYDPPETLLYNVDTPSPRDYWEGSLNGNIAFPLFGGRLALNGQLSDFSFDHHSNYYTTDLADNPVNDLVVDFAEGDPAYEVGLNYDRDIGPWSLALIGLVNRGNYSSFETGENIDYLGANDFTYLQDLQQESGESIVRATLSRSLTPRQRLEFGGEGAINTLDQTLVYAENGTPLTIPNSNVSVEEERAEFFVSHTWRPTDRWSVESRLNWETSTLNFTGDTNQEVPLSFWKPSLQVTRSFGANNQARFRIYRDVGQLDFGDFVSAASVADALIAGGNPDLAPYTAWVYEVGADLRLGPAALSLTLSHREITDVADLVLVRVPDPPNPDILYDAPGNLGDGQETRLDLNFSSPISFIPGARLTVEGYYRETEVEDPLIGTTRIISDTPESEVTISFRQDFTEQRWAWGVEAFKQGEFQAYRFNEIDTSEEGPWIDVWVETTALPYGMKLRGWIANAFDGNVNRDRRFFNEVDLGTGELLGRAGDNTSRDLRQRTFREAPWFILELSGTF